MKTEGIFESITNLNEARNICRSITIQWGTEFRFLKTGGYLSFNNDILHPSTVIPARIDSGLVTISPEDKKDIDISLYHELNHWYHFLRDTARYLRESQPYQEIWNTNVGQHYWPKVKEISDLSNLSCWTFDKDSFRSWQNPAKRHVSLEEIRNILGTCSNVKGFINGDDLSENLYRLVRKKKLRFGHCNISFTENTATLSRVKQDVTDIAKDYGIGSAVKDD